MIRCISCKYKAEVDTFTRIWCDPKGWKPIMCNRRDSDCFGSWLNITTDGEALEQVTWKGCEYGEQRHSEN
jgi:hypothetical protein